MEENVSDCDASFKAEKGMFSRIEDGDELYQQLCEIFNVNEKLPLRMPLVHGPFDTRPTFLHPVTSERFGQVSL